MNRWTREEMLSPTADDRFRRIAVDEPKIRSGLLGFAPHDVVTKHAHLESDEIFFMVKGQAMFWVDGREVAAEEGDTLYVTAGEVHGVTMGDEPVVMLIAVSPNLDDAWEAEDELDGLAS